MAQVRDNGKRTIATNKLIQGIVRGYIMNNNPKGTQFLEGKQVLILEDDQELAELLKELFENEGANVKCKECREEAQRELSQQGIEYDLIVLDIMLPNMVKQIKRIRELDKELEKVRRVLRQEDELQEDDTGLMMQLESAYDKRSAILVEREALIDREGGIGLLEELTKSGKDTQQLPPILVLTAVGKKDVVKAGLDQLGGCGDWIVKPVEPEYIIDKSVQLIQKAYQKNGEGS